MFFCCCCCFVAVVVVVVLGFFGGGDFKTLLEGSVDHIIYRDYIVNRRSFIYCSLTTVKSLMLTSFYRVSSAVMEL